jgi:hypothetical protein
MRSVGGSVNARMQQLLQLPPIKDYVVVVQEEEMVLIGQEEEVQPQVQSAQEEVSQPTCVTASSTPSTKNKNKNKNKKKQKRK